MSKRPKLFIDCDGCIMDSVKAVVDLYNEDYSAYKNFEPVSPDDIQTWSFLECNCATPEAIDTYFNTPRFFRKVEFMESAFDTLVLLSYDYDISIVSHGYSPNLKLKKDWLEKCLFSRFAHACVAQFIGVNLKEHDDKSCINMTGCIFLDDNTKNLRTCNAKYKVVFGKKLPWNEDDSGFTRCENWIDFYLYVRDISIKELQEVI